MNKNVAILFKHNGEELGTFEEVFEDVGDYNTVDCLSECIYYGCFLMTVNGMSGTLTTLKILIFS